MYETFYDLSEDPFRLLPDPDICYPHASCAKAWAYLQYAVGRGEGIVVVTGVPGSGKTTLAERLLRELKRDQTVSARLAANETSPTDLLRQLGYAFGLGVERLDYATLVHRLERFLIELERSNRCALVIVDEAQNLSHESLEAMRLLTDLQSHSKPVLQLFLLGHEELEIVMSAPRLAQFQQRVIASCRLQPMSLSETKAYLEYRLAHANWQGNPAIDGPAVIAIHHHSGGLPRQINKICSRLFLYGSAEEKTRLTAQDVEAVVQDLRDELLEPLGEAQGGTVPELVGDPDRIRQLALVPRPTRDFAPSMGGVAKMPDSRPAERPAAIAPNAERPVAINETPATRRAATERPTPIEETPPGIRQENEKGDFFVTRRYPLGSRDVGFVRRFSRGLRSTVRRPLRSLARVGRPLWASAQKPLSEWLRSGSTALGHGLSGRRLTAGAVASLAVVSIAAAVALNRPGPEDDDSSADGSASTAHPRTAAPSAAVTERVATPTVESGPLVDLMVDGKTVLSPLATESPVAYLTTIANGTESADIADIALVDLDALEPTSVPTPTGESNDPVSDPAPTETSEVIDRAVYPATGTPSVAVLEESETLMADGDRSVVLPPPAAGSPSVSVDYRTTFEEMETVTLLPVAHDPDEYIERPPTTDQSEVIEVTTLEIEELSLLNVSSKPVNEIPRSVADTALVEDAPREADEIERLLALADDAMQRDRLLFPESDSAYGYYKQVLALDEQNGEAIVGMGRIVHRYGALAQKAFERRELERAELFIGRALRIAPDSSKILGLRQKIETTLAEEQAQAAAERQREAEAARRAAAAARAEAARQAEANERRRSFNELIWHN